MKSVQLEQLAGIASTQPGNPRIVASGNLATPVEVLAALDEAFEQYTLHMLNATGRIPSRPGVIHETAFVGPAMRHSPGLHYVPCRLSLVPVLLQRVLNPDIVVIHTSLPRRGRVSMGIEVNILPGAIDAVRANGGILIAQANPNMPYTFGDAEIPVAELDYLVEVDAPLPVPPAAPDNEIADVIGERIAHHVEDGATLQLGIGAIPNAVLASLTHRRDLGFWSEMFSDGLLELNQHGCLDPDRPVTASFVIGSHELYEFIDRNRAVSLRRTEVTNDPARIAAQTNMTSINSALEVDLSAQANASRINGRIYSGFGGSTDFIVGALHSPRGHAFMALPSWHPKAGTSTIVPLITEPITSFQHSAIVTEQGMAEVFGRSEAQQAREIINHAAHPDVRAQLLEAATELGRI
ncbi:MAG: hypothetical protein KDC39_14800 [Actinobacteria bacterium]|nr:hypothetical protein [Actinomycetota bacterium]